VEERVVRSMGTVAVKCFKCGEEGHKCRECPLWEKKVKRVARPNGGKVHQEERRPVRPIREKAQEGEKRLRRVEEEKVVRPAVTNFIRPYLHQLSIDSHGLNGYGKPLKRPFDRYQSRLEAINNGRDIRQINW